MEATRACQGRQSDAPAVPNAAFTRAGVLPALPTAGYRFRIKKRAAARLFHVSELARSRTGQSTALIAKQFALEEILRDSGTIYRLPLAPQPDCGD